MVQKAEVISNINPFCDEPEWCLPPGFWIRAEPMTGYSVYALGKQVGLPARKCHTSVIRIMDNREDTPLECCTGYAYSSGYWTRHSWVVNRGDMVLLEPTPATFALYYGVILDGVEFEQFKEMMEV
jgi:hypothetical protein